MKPKFGEVWQHTNPRGETVTLMAIAKSADERWPESVESIVIESSLGGGLGTNYIGYQASWYVKLPDWKRLDE